MLADWLSVLGVYGVCVRMQHFMYCLISWGPNLGGRFQGDHECAGLGAVVLST